MSCSYVCASCRRRLLLRVHSLELKRSHSSSFISLHKPLLLHSKDQDKTSTRRANDREEILPAPRSIPEQQPLRSVEDDFVERVLEGKIRSNVEGLYSKPRKTRRVHTDSVISATALPEDCRPATFSPFTNNQAQPSSTPTSDAPKNPDVPTSIVSVNLPSQLSLNLYPLQRKTRLNTAAVTSSFNSEHTSAGLSFLHGPYRRLVVDHGTKKDPSSHVLVENEKKAEQCIQSIESRSIVDEPVPRNLAFDGITGALPILETNNSQDKLGTHKLGQKYAQSYGASSIQVSDGQILKDGQTLHSLVRRFSFNASLLSAQNPASLLPSNTTTATSSSEPKLLMNSDAVPSASDTHHNEDVEAQSSLSRPSSFLEKNNKGNQESVRRAHTYKVPGEATGLKHDIVEDVPQASHLSSPDPASCSEDSRWNAYLEHLQPESSNIIVRSSVKPLRSVPLRPRPPSVSVAPAELEKFITDPKTPLLQAWDATLRLRRQSSAKKLSLDVVKILFPRIVSSWCVGEAAGSQLSPSFVLQRFYGSSFSPLHLPSWSAAIWAVIARAIMKLRSLETTDQLSLQTLTQELLQLWILGTRRAASGQIMTKEGAISLLRNPNLELLIESEQMKEIRTWFSKDFSTRFLHFFPDTRHLMATKRLDTAALTSFVIFRERCRSLTEEDPEFQNYQSFQTFVARLLPYSNLSSSTDLYAEVLRKHGLSLEDSLFVTKALKELAENTVILPITKGLPLPVSGQIVAEQLNDATPQRQLEELFKRRLGRAVEGKSYSRVEAVWREAQSTYATDRIGVSNTGIPVSVYRHMLTALMALKRPNRAVDVWNGMIQAGVAPSVGTWDAMLNGCGIARDVQGINDVWTRMIESGLEPDAQVWATRIHSLTAAGDWQAGIRAFREMTARWVDKVQSAYKTQPPDEFATLGDSGGVPKPNTQTLNGLVAGLARDRKHNELVKVLTLARSIGIKADIYTFNPLFRSATQSGNSTLAVKLLTQMQSLGVQPDVATFTMVLQSLFYTKATSESPTDEGEETDMPEQIAAQVLQQMKSSGIEANAWTFATLINGLLKGPNGGNIEAAYAVLSHMADINVPLSSQIYTTLLTYHFHQEPNADIAAVEALWNRARKDSRVFLDVFFFDRLIEGFARSGEIGRMAAALAQAGKRGKVPSWIAMNEVIKASARVGDWTRVADIMVSIRGELISKDDVRPEKGKAEFMTTAAMLGYNEQLEIMNERTPSHESEEEDPLAQDSETKKNQGFDSRLGVAHVV